MVHSRRRTGKFVATNEVFDQQHANKQSARQKKGEAEEDGPCVAKPRLPACPGLGRVVGDDLSKYARKDTLQPQDSESHSQELPVQAECVGADRDGAEAQW